MVQRIALVQRIAFRDCNSICREAGTIQAAALQDAAHEIPTRASKERSPGTPRRSREDFFSFLFRGQMLPISDCNALRSSSSLCDGRD